MVRNCAKNQNGQSIVKDKLSFPVIMLLFFMVFIRPIGTMFDSSSLPAIAKYFCVTPEKTEQTVYVFIFFSALAPILFGTLSDKLGRKKMFTIGMLCFSISCFFSIFAKNINQLIALRALQGFGLGCEFAVTASIIKDYLGRNKKLAYGYSASEIVYGLSSIALPFLGGAIQQFYGWKACYFFMFISTFALCVLYIFGYNESNYDLKKINTKSLFLNHLKLLKDLKYFMLLIVIGTLSSFMYVFYAACPFIIENQFAKSALFFGALAFWISIIYVAGVAVNVLLLIYFNAKIILSWGILVTVLSVLILALLCVAHYINIYTFTALISAINFGIALAYANIHSIIVSLYPDYTGTVNAQIKFTFSFLGWFFVLLISLLATAPSILLLSWFYIAIASIIAICYGISLFLRQKTSGGEI